jgi:hypothetical protein
LNLLALKTPYNELIDARSDLYKFIFMLVAAIFTRELGRGSLFGIDYDWLGYTFFLLTFGYLVISRQLRVAPYLFWAWAYLFVASCSAKYSLGLSIAPLFKQLIPIIIISACTYFLVKKTDLQSLFNLYLKVSVWVAYIGFLQVLLSFAGIYIFSQFSNHRLDSLAEEPSHYAAIALPAVTYAFFNIKTMRKEFYVMLVALILTQSLTSIAVLLLIYIIRYSKATYLLAVIPFVAFIGYQLYLLVPMYASRIDGMMLFFSAGSVEDSTEGTSISFATNLLVALSAVKQNLLTGCGLGGHEEMYYRYFPSKEKFGILNYLHGLNAKSAHALSIRVYSELGLIGFGTYVITILRGFWIDKQSINYPIALGCISHFFSKSLKLGNYFDLGTVFFFIVLVECVRQSRIQTQSSSYATAI